MRPKVLYFEGYCEQRRGGIAGVPVAAEVARSPGPAHPRPSRSSGRTGRDARRGYLQRLPPNRSCKGCCRLHPFVPFRGEGWVMLDEGIPDVGIGVVFLLHFFPKGMATSNFPILLPIGTTTGIISLPATKSLSLTRSNFGPTVAVECIQRNPHH